jgi:putative hydrolase of HD superfamily
MSDPSTEIPMLLRFISTAEALKRELRHSWLSDGRRESVAEHTWLMSLLAVLFARRVASPLDLDKALRMVVVHDLVESVCGDVPSFEDSERMLHKAERERAAMQQLSRDLPDDLGAEISALWHEYEARETPEAKFVAALDKLEVQLQHNLAPLDTWEPIEYGLVYTKVLQPCAHDAFLAAVARAVIEQAERKMSAGGIDVAAVRAAHEARP